MKPIHKLNNGHSAPLYHKCSAIISIGLTQNLYCDTNTEEDNEDSWAADYVQCDLCNHKWAAVYPAKLDRIECSNCGNMVMFEKL